MRSTVIVVMAVVLSLAGAVSAQQFMDYSQVQLLRWMGSEPPDTYAEYLAAHPARSLRIEPVRMAPLRTPSAAGPPRVLVIANSALLPSIQAKVDRYIADVEAAGYAVDLYSSTYGTAEDVKAFIISQSTDLVGCVLFGDLPCAWYEVVDDHYEYGYASFPCDLYLMDLDGAWSDNETVSPMQSGVYDTHTGDTAPEIFVGRIDASRMSGDPEYAQVNDYLDKLHAWYAGEIQMTDYALTYTEDDWSESEHFWTDIDDAFSASEAIIAPDTDKEDYRDNRLTSPLYEFIQLACHSDPVDHYFTRGGELGSVEIKAIPPRALFYNLFCCSASRFTYDDFLGGAYIFNPSASALATIGSTKTGSMLNFWAFYQPLGEGKSFGQAFNEWFNAIAPYTYSEICWHYGMTIMGDPLIVPVSSDPSNIVLLQPNGGEVLVSGEEYQIQWWTQNVTPDSISILLSVDSGETYPYTVASGFPGSYTSYLWTVDEVPISLCRLKILSWYGGVVDSEDISDADFIIQSGPYKYVSPAGGDIYPYVMPAWAAHSIQDAVGAASTGDTIMVAEGTYSEN
ncbi:MAG TPA: hypothetical protein ENO08_01975, partial [Candidatus Eisenbacteria bacterium]|nr:hypothetical protein [Candidatus Eisenbacteria bacterium]